MARSSMAATSMLGTSILQTSIAGALSAARMDSHRGAWKRVNGARSMRVAMLILAGIPFFLAVAFDLAGASALARASALAAAVGEGQPESAPPERLPVNQWVQLPCKREPGYIWSRMIYVPSRKQTLHWGAVAEGLPQRNDVRAFDFGSCEWVPDSPSDEASVLEKARGVRVVGMGQMLSSGAPAPSWIVNGVTYDSRRGLVIYLMKGLMAAYDPQGRAWRDLEAATELDSRCAIVPDLPYGMYEHGLRPEEDFRGRRIAGGPPVYGAGICYDPANDELVLFSHWGAHNTDLRPFTGRVSSHKGTWVYSYKDKLWQRIVSLLGTAEVRVARGKILELLEMISEGLDECWRQRRKPDPRQQGAVAGRTEEGMLAGRLKAAAQGASRSVDAMPGPARAHFSKALAPLEAAAAAAERKDLETVLAAGSEALRALEDVLDGPLRIEPPPRCGAPMVCDPARKVIILFGGKDGLVRTDLPEEAPGASRGAGGLNDTWLYDLTARQWHDASKDHRPPPQEEPQLVFDDASGLALLVTRDARKRTAALWAFDAESREWSRRHEGPWPGDVARWSTVALDPERRILFLVQDAGGRQETFAMKLDLERLPSQEAPAREAPVPMLLQKVPPDDLAWLEKMRSLPANEWALAKPPREPERRDWGTLACDQVRGLVVYFGGGHASYQVNDVAIYSPGANRWAHAAGDHNDPVPPITWDGCTMSLRGGPPAGHQRNTYVAIDGRTFAFAGAFSRRWDPEWAREPGTRVSWFYDLDRGGVWRQERIADIIMPPGVSGTYGRVQMADPAGRVLGFGGHLEPYDGRFFADEAYFASYEIYRNRLSVRKIPSPSPSWVGECRPFCYLSDRDAVLFYEYRKDHAQETWLYDVKANVFSPLAPRRQPSPGPPLVVEHILGQGAVFAVIDAPRGHEQWVYSLERNDWAPLTFKAGEGDAERVCFQHPYGQLVFVAKYGVLVNCCGATSLLRPDLRDVGRE